MSWMSPSYLLQSGFDRTWTPLAGRYSLWLYREVGWEGHEVRSMNVALCVMLDRALAAWSTRAFHPRQCWLLPSSEVHCVLCNASVLFKSV